MQKKQRRFRLVAVLTAALVGSLLAPFTPIAPAGEAQAITGGDFNAGYIISDETFFKSDAMTEAQVQSFLMARVPSCVGANGQPCLRDYRATTYTRAAAEPGHCSSYAGEANESAARIIVKAARACGINPQVLIVMLQKEQGLVTATSPTERQYRVAMGYGCPDTAACDTRYYGFYNQVYNAAWQLRQYTNYPQRAYRIGVVNIGYNPNAACGSSAVNIRNQATANLYNYTPYQPNAAALANLRGIGDGCSAYGNRNFWVTFHDWFGAPTGPRDPMAYVDTAKLEVTPTTAEILISGWAMDPANIAKSIEVHVYIDQPNGTTKGYALTANGSRPDVGAAYPGAGPLHGYSLRAPVTAPGVYRACVFPITSAGGWLLGCYSFNAVAPQPVGNLDSVALQQTATEANVVVGGWAFDSSMPSGTSEVHIYVDRPDRTVSGYAIKADLARPDIGRVYPAAGPNHGFLTSIPIRTAGTYKVCAYAIGTSVLGSTNTQLGCRTLTAGASRPQGVLDSAALGVSDTGASEIRFSGWAIDQGNPTVSIPVHVYVDYPDGRARGFALAADGVRDDIARVFPGAGPLHGFGGTAPVDMPGRYRVCAYAIGVSVFGAANAGIGCRTVDVGGQAAMGALDSVVVSKNASGGSALVSSGWSFDPAVPATSNQVHLYIDRPDGLTSGVAVTANLPRSDIARIFPAAGSAHGFSVSWDAPFAGAYNVCAFGIPVSPYGRSALLGCTRVIVP